MPPETIFQYLIFIHAAAGGLALLAGIPALLYEKGSRPHIISGRFFFYGLLVASLTALVVSRMPGHENMFLFVIGIFSSFLIITGFRSLKIKKDISKINWLDHLVHMAMAAAAVYMILIGLFQDSGLHYVLFLFAGIALALLWQDSVLFYAGGIKNSNWMVRHLIRMIAGYIAATTAFVVVNQLIPGILGWIAPTVIGSALITFFARKYSR